MTKHYCDICGNEDNDMHKIDILVHAKGFNPLAGHVKIINGKPEPTSGRYERTECCLICYNKVMIPLWESIEKLKTESK